MTQHRQPHGAAVQGRRRADSPTRTSAGSGASCASTRTRSASRASSLFWALLRRQKRTLKWLFFVMIIYTVGLLQVANLTRGMVDNGIVEPDRAALGLRPLHHVLGAAGRSSSRSSQQQLADRLAYQIEFDMRVWLYTHIQSADLRRLDQVATGQLVTRSLTDIQLVDTLLRDRSRRSSATRRSAHRVGDHRHHPQPVHGHPRRSSRCRSTSGWSTSSGRRLRALSWAELNERAEVTTAIDEPVRGIRVVKAFGREDKERERVADVTERAFRFSMTRARLLAGYDIYLRIDAAARAGGAARRRRLPDEHRAASTVGTFLLAFQIGTGLSQFSSAFGEIASAWQYLRSAQDRIAEMLALSSRPVTDGRMIPLPSTGLELRGVEVTYGEPALPPRPRPPGRARASSSS